MTSLLLCFLLTQAICAQYPRISLQAQNHYLEGNFDEALRSYETLLTQKLQTPEVYLNSAILYRDQNRLNEAVRALEEAWKLDPKNIAIAEELAWFAYLNNDLKKARGVAKKIMTLNKQSTFGLLVLGLLFQEKGEWLKSFSVFKKLTDLYPANVLGPFYLGESLMNLGRHKEAAQAYKKVLERDYTFLEAHLPLARALKKAGFPDEAKKSYETILDVDPQHPQALFERNELLSKLAAEKEASSKWLEDEQPLEKDSQKPEPPAQTEREPAIQTRVSSKKKTTSPQKRGPLLRIAIGTSASGNPLPRGGLMLRSGSPFKIIKKSSKKLLAQGLFGQVWTIRMAATKIPTVEVVRPNGKTLGPFSEGIILEGARSNVQFTLRNVPYGQGFAWSSNHDRRYRGQLEILPSEEHGLVVINRIKLEDYLASVLASEMFPEWPLEALKVQAVIARSVALYKRKYEKPHKNLGYDLCDGQHCQVYIGVSAEREKTHLATRETQGEILIFEKKAINALYHANCGGKTHGAWELPGWWGAPYLASQTDLENEDDFPRTPWDFEFWIKGRPKAYCGLSSFVHPLAFRWVRVIAAQELEQRVNRMSAIGSLVGIEILTRTSAGYATALKIKGSQESVTFEKEHEIRRLLGLGQIRSNLVILDIKKNAEGLPETIFVFGGGWGHGVGLCQAGAAGLAEMKGSGYQEILNYYYQGVKLEKLKY